MKKLIFSLLLTFFATLSVNAQIATENQKLLDNTYVTVGGGVATPLAFDAVLPLNPTATIALGKKFNPVYGAELEGTAWFGSHAFGGAQSRFDGVTSHNIIRGSYVGLNGTMNITNLLKGYLGAPRKFELGTTAGLGWVHTYTPNVSDRGNNYLGAKTGLDFMYNFGKTKAHTISVKPAVLWNLSAPGTSGGNLAFNKKGAQLQIGVAYTYHFKTSNGTRHFKTYDVGAMMAEVDRLNAELAKKPKEVIREVVREVPARPNTNAVRPMRLPETNVTVFFAFDSAELDDRAKETLNKLGENGVYVVDGYASSEGSTEYNKELSQRRADAVKEYLEGRGCKVQTAEGHGVVFGPTTGRVVVVTNPQR